MPPDYSCPNPSTALRDERQRQTDGEIEGEEKGFVSTDHYGRYALMAFNAVNNECHLAH
jgi:hypothetical protein